LVYRHQYLTPTDKNDLPGGRSFFWVLDYTPE
jgi:hypothetical protein